MHHVHSLHPLATGEIPAQGATVQLSTFCRAGVTPCCLQQAKADKKRIRELERELRRKDKALAEAAAILVLRKKLNVYWGNDGEDS